jgi:transcriptional regulator with XRE-family HTH domain
MSTFRQQPLRTQQTIGEQLHAARQAKGLSLAELSARLKISERYLEALERGRYNDLPSPVYIKNYLRAFAKAVGIDWEKLAEKFASEITVYQQKVVPKHEEAAPQLRSRRAATSHRPAGGARATHQRALEIPRLVKIGVAGIVVLLVVLYFGWGLAQFLSPPDLVVSEPAGDLIVTDQKLTVRGSTEPEAIVEINGQPIAVDPDGTFVEEVFLHPGLNTLRITAQSQQSQERVILRNVLYDTSGNTAPAPATAPDVGE